MPTQSGGWLSVRAAARRLEIPYHKMCELVRNEAVETLKLPRSRPLVSAEDLERLRKQAHRPAVRHQAAETF